MLTGAKYFCLPPLRYLSVLLRDKEHRLTCSLTHNDIYKIFMQSTVDTLKSRSWNFRLIGSDVSVPFILHANQWKKSLNNGKLKRSISGNEKLYRIKSIKVTVISRQNSDFLSA